MDLNLGKFAVEDQMALKPFHNIKGLWFQNDFGPAFFARVEICGSLWALQSMATHVKQ